MTHIYIVTKNGKTYTTDGQKYIQNMLADKYNVTDKLSFVMGNINNNVEGYIAALETYPSSYTVLSLPDAMLTISPDQNEGLVNTLKEYIENKDIRTTWELLKELHEPVLT